ncbi:MAG: hypothetical protein R3199_03590 [Gemmatimonadota bacterium]|nr:hypothetical protein [Gemmatimonadota bacterium]
MTLVDQPVVIALWWIALALTVLVIVPVAVWLLHRARKAATDIRVFTADTLEAARGIAGHTSAIGALDATIEAAGPLIEKADAIEDATAELERVLQSRSA